MQHTTKPRAHLNARSHIYMKKQTGAHQCPPLAVDDGDANVRCAATYSYIYVDDDQHMLLSESDSIRARTDSLVCFMRWSINFSFLLFFFFLFILFLSARTAEYYIYIYAAYYYYSSGLVVWRSSTYGLAD